jgi:plastocyanin
MTGWKQAVGYRGVRRRGSGLVLGVVLASGVLAGCGNGSPQPSTPTPTAAGVGTVTTAPDGVQEITLQTHDDYVFTPDAFTVAPGKVRLTVVNAAEQLTHNFTFPSGEGPQPIAEEIPLLTPGEQKTIEFTVDRPGKYRFVCSFHTQLGQVGTMTVSG